MTLNDCRQINSALELDQKQEAELNEAICELHPHKRLVKHGLEAVDQFFSLMRKKYGIAADK